MYLKTRGLRSLFVILHWFGAFSVTSLLQAQQQAQQGRYAEALHSLSKLDVKTLRLKDQLRYYATISDVLLRLEQFGTALSTVDVLLRLSQARNRPQHLVRALLLKVEALIGVGNLQEAGELLFEAKKQNFSDLHKPHLMFCEALLAEAMGQLTKAEQFYQRTLVSSRNVNDGELLARSYWMISRLYWRQGLVDKAQQTCMRGLAIAGDEYLHHKIRCFNLLGILEQEKTNFDQAFTYYQRSLKLAEEELCSQNSVARTYQRIGNLMVLQNRPDEALSYFMEALTLYRSLGKQAQECELTHGIASVFIKKANYKDALEWLEKSKTLAKNLESTRLTTKSLALEGRVALEQLDLVQAKSILRSCLELSGQHSGDLELVGPLWNLGHAYLLDDEYEEAVAVYDEIKHIYEVIGNPDYLAEVLLMLVITHYTEGNNNRWEPLLLTLEQLSGEHSHPMVGQAYSLAQATVLMDSHRLLPKMKALRSFTKVSKAPASGSKPHYQIYAKANKLKLLGEELALTANPDVLGELTSESTKLLELCLLSYRQHMALEVFILLSRLALLGEDNDQSKLWMIKAQEELARGDLGFLRPHLEGNEQFMAEVGGNWEKLDWADRMREVGVQSQLSYLLSGKKWLL